MITTGEPALSPEDRLIELGITLPTPPKPVAAYVPFVRTGNLVFIAGQIPMADGGLRYSGTLYPSSLQESHDFVSTMDAKAAARQCILNAMAVLKDAIGSLNKVQRCVRLGVFVACHKDFIEHPAIANGASECVVQVFGDAGKHARAAVGSSSLPLGACVEVESLWEVRD